MKIKRFFKKVVVAVASIAVMLCMTVVSACGSTPPAPSDPEPPEQTTPVEPLPPTRVEPPIYVPCKHENLETWQKRPAKCNAVGYEKYWVCINCGDMFADQTATEQITEPTIIPAAPHAPTEKTGRNEKEHYRICGECGGACEQEPHKFDQNVATDEFLKTEASESGPAEYYRSCLCGASSADTFVKYTDNILVGKPAYTTAATGAVGSADWGDGHRYGGIEYINDGDEMSRYNAAGGFDEVTVIFDLQELYDLRGVTLCQYDGRISEFAVYVSTDENDWQKIDGAQFVSAAQFDNVTSPNDCNAGGNNTREYSDFLFDSVCARYVKIELISTNGNITIWEVGAFGYPAEYGDLVGLEIAAPPAKTKYLTGNKFDDTGMNVRAVYEFGSKFVSDYTIDKTGELTADDKFVTVSFTDGSATETASVEITVSDLIPQSLTAEKTKNLYYGDGFKDGYAVSVVYRDGTQATVTDYSVNYNGPLGSADNGKTVSISYTEVDITLTAEVEISVTEAPSEYSNIAMGKSVSTSGNVGGSGSAFWSDNHLYGGVEYLTDGDLDSRINSASATVSYTIDLGGAYSVGQLGLSAFDMKAFSFRLYVSDDGENWTNAIGDTDMRSPNDGNDVALGRNNRDIVKFDFEKTAARYVRLDINASENISLWEILVYGEATV